MLYPPPEREEDGGGPSTKLRSNSYEPFRMLDTRIEEGLNGMAEEEQQRLDSDTDQKGINGESTQIRSTQGKLTTRPTSPSLSIDESTMSYVPLPRSVYSILNT